MHRILFLIALCFIRHSSHATESGATPIEEGKSPDGQMEVVSVPGADGSHFEIRTSSGATVFSEESLKEEFGGRASFAETVLWRPDSRFVAIAFGTYKFAVETVVFRRDDHRVTRVPIPQYHDPNAEIDNVHCVPRRWLKNGDLVLDITTGYHTKSDGGITGYYATVRFAGNTPKGVQRSRTKVTNRD